MIIQKISLLSFRNYEEVAIEVPAGPIHIVGSNGAGKTNLLESVYFLGLCRSFRTSRIRDLVRFDSNRMIVRADVESREGSAAYLVDYDTRGDRKWYINGNHIPRLTDYVGNLPVICFIPDDLSVVKGDPGERRRFLDIWLGQVSREYLFTLKRYQEILKQRNAFLGRYGFDAFDRPEVSALDEMLIMYGSSLVKMRAHYIKELTPIAVTTYAAITGSDESFEISYKPNFEVGDNIEESLTAALIAHRAEEKRRRVSVVGPHRDDVEISLAGRSSRRFASQGQQRSVALTLRLSQYEYMKRNGNTPILLLDDVSSELDSRRQQHLLQVVAQAPQVWITTTDKNDWGDGCVIEIKNGKVNS